MLPRSVTCEECGEKAIVRGYGRVEYDWDQTGHVATTLKIKVVRLTIDCPRCGVRVQEHRPVGHDED
jgi:transcription elongation factor Elf1